MNNIESKSDSYKLSCLLIVTVFAFLMSLQKVYDYDTWFHLRFGQVIFDSLSVPIRDIFSFSTPEAPWTNLYWLSDPLFFLIHKFLGITGLQLFVSTVIALAAAFLLLFLLRCGISPFWATALVMATVEISRFRFLARPLVFKFAGIVFLLWFLYREEQFKHREIILFLVVLLWISLHPSAFIAQVVMAMLVGEQLLRWATRSREFAPAELKKSLIYFAVVSLALLLTPNGLGYYQMIYGHVFSDVVVRNYAVEEHRQLIPAENLPFLALAAFTSISFLLGRKNFRWLSLLLFAAFVWLAFGSMRYVALSSFVLTALIGVNLQGWRWAAPGGVARGIWLKSAAVVLLAAGGVLLLLTTFRAGKVYEFGLGINRSRFPYAAVERLQSLGFSGNIYNSWIYGGFLLWNLPAAKTFIDGRCLPAQLELYERFLTIELHDFARYMAQHEVKAALIERRHERDIQYFNAIPGFRLAHADDLAVLFLHQSVLGGQPLAAPAQYRYLRIGGYDYEYLQPLAKGAEAGSVEAEILMALQSSPDNFFINFLLGYFYDVRGDERAAAQYVKAASHNPGFAYTHFQLGERAGAAALRSGQWELAEKVATEGLKYQKNGTLYFLLGGALQKQGKFAQAETAYRRSLAAGENVQVLNNLGFLLIDAGKPREAVVVFDSILNAATRSHDEQALYGLALTYRKLNDLPRAASYRNLLAEKYPGSKFLRSL